MKTRRNRNLTRPLSMFVGRSVASGRDQDASGVVREALRAFEPLQREDGLKLKLLRSRSRRRGRMRARAGR